MFGFEDEGFGEDTGDDSTDPKTHFDGDLFSHMWKIDIISKVRLMIESIFC